MSQILKFGLPVLALIIGAVYFLKGDNYVSIDTTKNAQAQTTQSNASQSEQELTEAWFTRCNDEAGVQSENKRGKCEIFQRQNIQETGQRVIEFAIGYPEGQENARGILILPLGILLTTPVQMQVDDGAVFKFQVRTCTANGCFAFVTLTPEILDMMRKGTNAFVQMEQDGGQPIRLQLPLKGFTKAINQIG